MAFSWFILISNIFLNRRCPVYVGFCLRISSNVCERNTVTWVTSKHKFDFHVFYIYPFIILFCFVVFFFNRMPCVLAQTFLAQRYVFSFLCIRILLNLSTVDFCCWQLRTKSIMSPLEVFYTFQHFPVVCFAILMRTMDNLKTQWKNKWLYGNYPLTLSTLRVTYSFYTV